MQPHRLPIGGDVIFHGGWPRSASRSPTFPTPTTATIRSTRWSPRSAMPVHAGAAIVCFPECYVPGYRTATRKVRAAGCGVSRARVGRDREGGRPRASIAVILGTERVIDRGVLLTALVINADGTIAGFQDKGQLDPSEEGPYVMRRRPSRVPGRTDDVRRLDLPRGLAVPGDRSLARQARRAGRVSTRTFTKPSRAAIGRRPSRIPANTFHEKAALCRAAENTCFFAMVNYASDGSPTTSAIVRPDGTCSPISRTARPGLLIADLDLDEATRLLAMRCKEY